MVVPKQVQHAMYDQQLDLGFERMSARGGLLLGALHRDEDVAQVTAARLRVRLRGGEGQHVGGGVDVAELAVEVLQLLVVGQHDGQVGIRNNGLVLQRGGGGPLDDLGLDQNGGGNFDGDHGF